MQGQRDYKTFVFFTWSFSKRSQESPHTASFTGQFQTDVIFLVSFVELPKWRERVSYRRFNSRKDRKQAKENIYNNLENVAYFFILAQTGDLQVQNRSHVSQIPGMLINLLFITLGVSKQSPKQCYIYTFATSCSISQLCYFPFKCVIL